MHTILLLQKCQQNIYAERTRSQLLRGTEEACWVGLLHCIRQLMGSIRVEVLYINICDYLHMEPKFNFNHSINFIISL
jgi:hypothetical protein